MSRCERSVSVCMAAYNGERFIREQIESILPQLDRESEIVVVDDASKDATVRIIEGIGDPRIRIVRHERNHGVVRAFERALSESRGELIFLCDQDDVWHADKVKKIKEVFKLRPEISLVISNGIVIGSEGRVIRDSWLDSGTFRPGLVRNLVQNRYLGCAMAFRRSLLGYCLPFPVDTPMHDMWIGLVNQLVGESVYIAEPLFSYRRHGNNATTGVHASVTQMLKWRLALAKNLTTIYVQNVIPNSMSLLSKGN